MDSVTASILELSDAMAEVDWYIFDETHERFSSLIDDLETIRDLIAPNAEEDWFDDEGMWTEKGVASLATYVQALEMYEDALDNVNTKLKDYNKQYAGNEAYYKKLGIDSEQELYDAREKLIDQQYEYAQSISDSEQSVVDMYEAQIDAIEEYTGELVESYNEYIDVVKNALEAERDLFEFKKDIEKQTKDINELERRIASLSGSDNASDVAERRKLEAELYEAKEGLNDTYYDHAKDSQMTALEKEAEAYEESLNNYVEKLRTTLEEAQVNMGLFMESVTSSVMLNAGAVKEQYIETGVTLDDALVKPWDKAIAEMSRYETDGLSKMNSWTTEEGFFGKFKTDATNQLKSPWTAGTNAAKAFKTDVSNAMSDVVEKIKSNVTTAKTQLSNLYQQIKDTEKKASDIKIDNSGGNDKDKDGGSSGYKATATLKTSLKTFTSNGQSNVEKAAKDSARSGVLQAAYNYYRQKGYSDEQIYKFQTNTWDKNIQITTSKYAKGTLGTKRDEYAITDEPWLGDELTMYATKQGTLSYMRAGSTVVPADLTKELISIGEVGLDGLTNMPKFDSGINLVSNMINKPEFNLTFDNLLHIDNCTKEVLPEVKKLVESQLDKFTRQLNYSLKKVGAR